MVKSTEESCASEAGSGVLEGHGSKLKWSRSAIARPAVIDRQSPVVALADAALRAVGREDVDYIVSSTDANRPSAGAIRRCAWV